MYKIAIGCDPNAKTEKSADEKGYYVSREMAEAYIISEKKVSRYVGTGFMFWALAGIPYVMFPAGTTWRLLGMAPVSYTHLWKT